MSEVVTEDQCGKRRGKCAEDRRWGKVIPYGALCVFIFLAGLAVSLGMSASKDSAKAVQTIETYKAGSDEKMKAMQSGINRVEASVLRIEDKIHGDPS